MKSKIKGLIGLLVMILSVLSGLYIGLYEMVIMTLSKLGIAYSNNTITWIMVSFSLIKLVFAIPVFLFIIYVGFCFGAIIIIKTENKKTFKTSQ